MVVIHLAPPQGWHFCCSLRLSCLPQVVMNSLTSQTDKSRKIAITAAIFVQEICLADPVQYAENYVITTTYLHCNKK